MAEVVVPQLPPPQMHPSNNLDPPNHSPYGMESTKSKSPNSEFVFPSVDLSLPPLTHHQRGPTNPSASAHRRRPSNLSISALPPSDFGFAPNDTSLRPLPSPTRSPSRLTPPGHHSGHRRGGSEFVGGDIAHGGPVLVTTNVSQDENSLPIPSSPHKGPPAGRARHSHRRSGAVSQSDIKMIMQPSTELRADSAPQTPSRPPLPQRLPGPERSSSFPGPGTCLEGRSDASRSSIRSEGVENRSRVGFSDQLEFIPRPLSTISSETSSSMSTVRAQHSISESVGSSAYSGPSSPPSNSANSPVDSYGSTGIPSVSGETSDRVSKDMPMSADVMRHGLHVPAFTKQSGSLGATSLDQECSENHGITGQPEIIVSDELKAGKLTITDHTPNSVGVRSQQRSLSSIECPRPRTSPCSKVTKGQQKTRPWTTMLHRKDRQTNRHSNAMDSSTISAPAGTQESDHLFDDINLDDDTTLIIEEHEARTPFSTKLQAGAAHHTSELSSPFFEQASPSPMIDLDAALDSLGSPKNDPEFDDYSNKFSSGKRRLHSSGETGGFVGQGMHYHRRADSAPEMENFERSRYGFPRLGSNPAMEEAIEEEEEDVDQDAKRQEEQAMGLGVKIVESDSRSEESPKRRISNRSSAGHDRGRSPGSTLPSFTTFQPVEIVEAEEEPRFSVITKSSDESTITPTVSPDPLSYRPPSAPIDSAFQTPSLSYGTTPDTPSAVSSADYRKTLFDIQEPHIRTASSSVTGVTLDSSKGGTQGAVSVEDVPSLTSSASTMLSGPPNRYSSSGHTFTSADRPASLSAAAPARTRPHSSSKRSSLASLSKLVGGSYNRSKLNIAETLPPDTPEKSAKKRHRISRMMKFWKSKEKLSAG